MRKLSLLLLLALLMIFNAWGISIEKDSSLTDSIKASPTEKMELKNGKDSTFKSTSIKQEIATDTAGLDKIIKKDGEIILAKIIAKNIYEIEYKIPGENESKKITKTNIKEIRYSNGKVELTDDNPEKRPKDWAVTTTEREWAKIKIVTDASEVSGLVEKGPIEAEFEAKKVTIDNETLERTATVLLKKKAFALKASTILILEKNIDRQYGELPSIKIKATAYANE